MGPPKRIPGCNISAFPTNSPHLFITVSRDLKISQNPAYLAALESHSICRLAAHTSTVFRKLSWHIGTKICKLKIKQLVAIARRAHDSPSGITFTGRGTLATARGEILLISSCHADMATTRPMKGCFQDLPVTYMGKRLFRDTITFALTTSSYKATCSRPPLHLIKGIFHEQSSGRGVKDIKGIAFNLPHSEILSQEHPIFEAVA